jgi:hypothetical protein
MFSNTNANLNVVNQNLNVVNQNLNVVNQNLNVANQNLNVVKTLKPLKKMKKPPVYQGYINYQPVAKEKLATIAELFENDKEKFCEYIDDVLSNDFASALKIS